MAHRTIAPGTYIIVCVILVLLTILTVSVSFVPLVGAWHLAIGLAIATCKASLVVLFFMHVIASSRLTWAVIVVGVFWLGILFVLTFNDYINRGMVPRMPGH